MNNNQKMVGRMIKVMVEGKEGKKYFGRSYKDAPEIDGNVFFSSNEKHNPGEFTYVKIKEATEYDLIGEEINEYSE
jgi:ribosomal protein S12 methylthiotransferase